MIGAYGKEGDPQKHSRAAIALWEKLVRVREDDSGEIVDATCVQHPDPSQQGFSEVFVQRHPEHLGLLGEMIAFGEEHYAHPERNRLHLWIYEDDTDLIDVLVKRGDERKDDPVAHHLESAFADLPELKLPEGFRLLSMAEESDIEKRREVFGRGFDHADPGERPSAFAYRELQRAPDYRKEHDLLIVTADGTYATCHIVWYDAVNRIGHLEPLATHPDYRRMGLATQIQFEGMRRPQALGATHTPMTGGSEPFYRAVGFKEQRTKYVWIKQF
jgi:predicted N-acetyltransferase YhbS